MFCRFFFALLFLSSPLVSANQRNPYDHVPPTHLKAALSWNNWKLIPGLCIMTREEYFADCADSFTDDRMEGTSLIACAWNIREKRFDASILLNIEMFSPEKRLSLSGALGTPITLMNAIKNNHMSLAHTILTRDHALDVNQCNDLGETPLHVATRFKNTQAAQLLFKRGALLHYGGHANDENLIHLSLESPLVPELTILLLSHANLTTRSRGNLLARASRIRDRYALLVIRDSFDMEQENAANLIVKNLYAYVVNPQSRQPLYPSAKILEQNDDDSPTIQLTSVMNPSKDNNAS